MSKIRDWERRLIDEHEYKAQNALRMAKAIFRNNRAAGERRLRTIQEEFPETDAAAEARRLLMENGPLAK